MPEYSLSLNGGKKTVQAPGDMPLLWVLRDLLSLPGTKFGCGIGQCRSCTVHLDGKAVLSCMVPISAVGDAAITTIEGLNGDISRQLEKAWVAEQVPQCGYCQPGQIMAAAALLAQTPQPGDAEIDRAMQGNLCRCGTYNRIRRAIHRAAKEVGQ